jgi:amino acid adenylation domain-containing protein/non-ribosomal peptide synthase protein (TIGR01720 family)
MRSATHSQTVDQDLTTGDLRGSGTTLLLSPGERALWFLHQLAPGGGAYNIAAAARLLTPLDGPALEQAVQALVDRHAGLRTTFPSLGGELCRQVFDRLMFALTQMDATGWSEERLRSRWAEEAWRPFDLERGPLLRMTLWTGTARGPVLLLVMHHIVADFGSLAILMRELPALYREATGAGTASLGPPGPSYLEYVRLAREAVHQDRGEASLSYWRERLAGLPTLDLVTDRPRTAVQTQRGDVYHRALPAEVASALRSRGRAQQATLFMTLLAAFQALLYRYTGQEDLAVGSPRSGRPPQFAGTVGYFVNPVVLRGDLTGDPSFTELLERTRTRVLADFKHGDFPLALLVEHLQPDRDASRTPLFQATFVLQKEMRGVSGITAFPLGEEGVAVTLGSGEIRLESLSLHQPPVPFDLQLQTVAREEGLSFALQYSSDLFDRTTAARLLERFATLLHGASGRGPLPAAPERRLSELRLFSEVELHQTTREWSDSGTSWEDGSGPEVSVSRLLEAQAARRPQTVAVVCGEEALTYGELHRRANRLAHRLRRVGVVPEATVGVLLERSPAVAVGLLGVLKAGGAYVPLDPALPAERLAWMAEDAGLAALLTDERSAEALPVRPSCPVLQLDSAGPDLLAESAAEPVPWAVSENLAYVIYTSGSTGRPKGVEVSHRALVNFLASMRERPGLQAADTLLAVTTIAFDIAALEIFLPLAVGARVVLARREEAADGAALARRIAWSGATALQATPATWQTLSSSTEADFSSLLGMCGGEAVDPGLAALWVGRTRSFWNLYGPTETTVWSTRERLDDSGHVTIGRPIANTRIVLLDRLGHPVPSGAAGHLHIGGSGLARGYLHRPELTAERFVPDPLPAEPGARLYRTGDLARHRVDGTLEFLGRLDHQVKLRGFRVEPGEIEAALRQHPGVREAAVVLHQRGGGLAERRLHAFVVGSGETPLTAEALRRFLETRLPVYMLPAFWTVLPELPLTPSGKVDRKALAAQKPPRAGAKTGRAPRTPAEELLAGIFAEALNLERVGVDASFFELGGHSLLATQVVSRVRAVFGLELPVRAVFEAPTAAALAARIERERAGGAGTAEGLPPIRRVPRQDLLPLSFSQQRLWVLDQLQPGLPTYNLPGALRLAGPLAVDALLRSLGEVVRRHEVLRTRFPAGEGLASQVIEPPSFFLPQVDLSGLLDPRDEEESARLVEAESRRPFDLAAGPLVRAVLLRHGADSHTLLVTLHHIVADGWSLGVLVRELGAGYASFSAGREPRLLELPIQYADYAVWQRERLQGEVLEAQLAYWRKQLGDAVPPIELPTDRPRPATATFRGGRQDFGLLPLLGGALKGLGREAGCTAFMVLLAGFETLLHRYTGQDDLPVGSPIAGRTRRETEPLLGLFVNTLVLRGDLSGDPTVRSLLDRVRRTALDAYAHQELPFEKLVDALQPQRDLSRTPLVQVLFNLRNAPLPPLFMRDLEIEVLEVPTGVSRFDLELSLAAADEGFAGELLYSSDLFDAATIRRFAQHLRNLMEGMADGPERRLSELPMLSAAEVRQLLGDWVEPGPRQPPVHEQLALRAARTPHATALVFKRERLTYRDLDGRANAVARHLRELGVGPEMRVGLFLERSLDLVVGLLGIWKAGGAFLPLDPDDPAERRKLLLADSGTRVAVTRRGLTGRLPAGVAALAIEEVAAAGEPAGAAVASRPEDLAYVIYTSGSAGRPKGVLVEHGNLSRLMQATERELRWDAADVMPCLAKFSFDIFLFELLGPLLAGGISVLVPLDPVPDLEEVVRLLDDATRLHAVPVLMRQIVDWAERRGTAGRYLRTLFVGGDTVPVELLRDLRRVFPRAELRVLYGPTEGTILATSHRVPERPERPERTLIGRPLPGVKAILKDRRGNLVPVGPAGEIHLGGVGIARGYLHQAELSREKFIVREGERWYRTGDLARLLPSGDLEFLGRIDEQVKIRGVRVEPGEIEAVLAEHPEVRECAVVARGAAGERRLVAWVVPRSGVLPAAGELRSFLRGRLSESLVPASFSAIEALPLTAHGKVDRRALAARTAEGTEGTAGKTAAETREAMPITVAEAALARIWSEMLDRQEIGRHDNFFELGGDSILSIQLVARARQAGLRISPRQIFEHQTIAELATVASVAGGLGAEQGPVIGAVPLTPVQHRFFERDLKSPHHFNQALMLRVGAGLAPGVVEQACDILLAHHDALRLRFSRDGQGGSWRQVEAPPGGRTPFLWLDLSGLSPQAGGIALRSAAEQVQASLDLAAGPITRMVWAGLPRAEARLLWVIHHLAVDGVSWRVLLEDLDTSCRQLARGETVALPPKTTSFKHWADRLVEHALTLPIEPELHGWLAATKAAPLPLDARGEDTVASERTVSTALDEEATRALLQEVPQVYHTQINDALLTALARTLAGPDGVLGLELEGHGREEILPGIDLSRTVGWFTVEYPVRLAVTPEGDPGADLKSVKEQLRAVPGRGIGYGLLRYLRADDATTAGAAPLSRLPSLDVAFNYLGQLDRVLPEDALFTLAEEPAGPPQSRDARRAQALALACRVIDGRLRIDWTYSEVLHRRATVEQWAAELTAQLRELILHCRSSAAGGYTPSDFDKVSLRQEDLDDLLAELEEAMS